MEILKRVKEEGNISYTARVAVTKLKEMQQKIEDAIDYLESDATVKSSTIDRVNKIYDVFDLDVAVEYDSEVGRE